MGYWFGSGVGVLAGMVLFRATSSDANPLRDLSIGIAAALAMGAYGPSRSDGESWPTRTGSS